MKHLLFWGLVPAVLAAAQLAQAQVQYLEESKACIVSATPASGTGDVSYQWFRNGEPIAGATEPNYIVPDYLAYGTNVEFKRRVVSSTCPGDAVYTNVVIVTFTELVVNGVAWAQYNVDDPQTFASRPDMYTKFYKWGNNTAWAVTGSVSWNNSFSYDQNWSNSPCPSGWRLPTSTEAYHLTNTGSTWANANSSRGNAVAGRFFGHNNASCKLPDNMYGCIFLPAVGRRAVSNGALEVQSTEGYYWLRNSFISGDDVPTMAYRIYFNNSSFSFSNPLNKVTGASLRCVVTTPTS